MLVVAPPQTVVAVVVGKVVDARAVLLVIEPLAFIFLAVEESVGAETLTTPLMVFTFVKVPVLICSLPLAVRLVGHHLALILATVFRDGRAKRDFLRTSHQWKCCE